MAKKAKKKKEAKKSEWLAGVKTKTMIHYVAFTTKKPKKPGWTPYAAMAKRWKKEKDAILAAQTAVKAFDLESTGGEPVLQTEEEAFKGNGMECERIELSSKPTLRRRKV